jgi:hypothetical protein
MIWRCETSIGEEPARPPTSKTQWKKHMKSVFDELELVMKMTISSKLTKRNTKQEPRKMMQDAMV